MLLVENNLNEKMAYLMFALRYFDISGFLGVVDCLQSVFHSKFR